MARQPLPLPLVPNRQQMEALRDIANHRTVLPPMYRILASLGLIEQKLGKWNLTQAGQLRLQHGGGPLPD
jgi:hypothetical protein